VGTETGNGGFLERPRLGLILGLLLTPACGHDDARPAFAVPGQGGQRIVVEVLNITRRGGLARTGTRVLRQAGIDVVGYGNAVPIPERSDSTRILVRRGDRAAGERVRRALQVGTIVMQPDSTRLVDVSVLLGADFAARAPLDFHP
jgi:LytR cell envelope-related transcriptional attenuator